MPGTSTRIAAAPTASDGRITSDLTCLNCGYNLRGLTPESSCPECGMSVRSSLREDRLGHASPAWLGRLQRGAKVLNLGVILALPLLYVGAIMAAGGLWMLTAPEPDRPEPAADWRSRVGARCLLALGTCLLCVLLGVAAYLTLRGALGYGWRFSDAYHAVAFADAVLIAAHGFYFLGVLAAARYVRGLARRIPDPPLVRACNRLMGCWIAAISGLCILALAADIANQWLVQAGSWRWRLPVALIVLTLALLAWLWWETLRWTRGLKRALAGMRA